MQDEPTISPIQKHLLADITRKVGELKEGFDLIEKQSIRTIPEAIFVRDFLPLFSGKYTTNRAQLLATWYLIAGSPYEAVNVVTPNGAVVVQVPSVLNREAITVAATRGNDLSSVFEEAKQRSAMSPRLGDSIINAELQTRLDSMVPVTESLGISPAWLAVLSHYDPSLKTVGRQNGQSSDDSDFDMS